MAHDENTGSIEEFESQKHELTNMLRDHGVPVDQWTGREGTKTVGDLLKEIQDGETKVEVVEGKLMRRTNASVADIYYTDHNGKTWRLKETEQVSKVDGSVKKRPHLKGAMAEKMKFGENPKEGVIRGVKEELKLESGIDYEDPELIIEKRDTETYPGLKTEYTLHLVKARMNDEAYNPDGYQEDQPTKIIYFNWVEA